MAIILRTSFRFVICDLFALVFLCFIFFSTCGVSVDPTEWFRRDRTKLNHRQRIAQGYGSCLLSLLHVAQTEPVSRTGKGWMYFRFFPIGTWPTWALEWGLHSYVHYPATLKYPLCRCTRTLFDPKETIRDAMVSVQTFAYAAVLLGYFCYTDPFDWIHSADHITSVPDVLRSGCGVVTIDHVTR